MPINQRIKQINDRDLVSFSLLIDYFKIPRQEIPLAGYQS